MFLGETKLGKRNGSLASGGLLVRVTPNTVELARVSPCLVHPWQGRRGIAGKTNRTFTYHLVIAYDSHDGQRLHAEFLRVKVRLLIEDDIRVDVGV